jgi:hypothetical protein
MQARVVVWIGLAAVCLMSTMRWDGMDCFLEEGSGGGGVRAGRESTMFLSKYQTLHGLLHLRDDSQSACVACIVVLQAASKRKQLHPAKFPASTLLLATTPELNDKDSNLP